MLELRDVAPDQLRARSDAAVERVAALRAAARFQDLATAREQVEEQLAMTDRSVLLDVAESGAGHDEVVGQIWLSQGGGEELIVHDLQLDDLRRVPEVVRLVVDRARAAGARLVGLGVLPGDPARAALGEQPGFLLRATNMALTLDGEIADPGGLELRTMAGPEFDDFLSGNTEEYAGELAAAGMTEEAAGQRAREQMQELVPDGQASPHMHFFTAWAGDTPVGSLWLCTQDPMAFVYDVVIEESQRRRGYGAAVMNAGARWCRDAGHLVLGLNVFAHNPGARALYDKLGYRVTQDYVALDVPDGD